ncbi:MAG: hypothetical protein M3069_14185 [Chloroflexota bacterium]|nr:hypothetical protein [Chloroflexota bacterium]
MTGAHTVALAGRFVRSAVALSLLLSLTLVLTPGLASADAQLGVATFDDERPAVPGATVERDVRVSNLGDTELRVRVEARGIDLLDDGAARVRDAEDPRWTGQVVIAQPEVVVPPHDMTTVPIVVAIPSDTPPDDYLLGISVTPQVVGDGIRIVNSVGVLLPISVQGDRVRSLALVEHKLPLFLIGDEVTGTVRIRNTGTTFAAAWIEAHVDNELTGANTAMVQVRGRTRVAPDTSRMLSYTWQSGITAGRFRVPVHVFYNLSNSSTAELLAEEEIWVIHPLLLASGAAVLLLAAISALVVLRRRTHATGPQTGPLRAAEEVA